MKLASINKLHLLYIQEYVYEYIDFSTGIVFRSSNIHLEKYYAPIDFL